MTRKKADEEYKIEAYEGEVAISGVSTTSLCFQSLFLLGGTFNSSDTLCQLNPSNYSVISWGYHRAPDSQKTCLIFYVGFANVSYIRENVLLMLKALWITNFSNISLDICPTFVLSEGTFWVFKIALLTRDRSALLKPPSTECKPV